MGTARAHRAESLGAIHRRWLGVSGHRFGPAPNRALSGIGLDYADIAGDPNIAGDRSKAETLARYFNPAAFVLAQSGTFGNAPRSLLRGPGAATFDLSFSKGFAISEQHRILMRLEMFNAFNRANFSAPFAQVNTPARFGRIESAGDPRIMQVALKYNF